MRLQIARQQKQDRGNVTFLFWCKLELTQEESELVRRYGQQNKELTYKLERNYGVGKLKLSELMQGIDAEQTDVTSLAKYEKDIKEACINLKNLLRLMSIWDGQQVEEL